MPLPTMLEVAKLNLGVDNPNTALIEENIKNQPELRLFPSFDIDGISYPSTVRTGYPTASFRQYNQGVLTTNSTFKNVTVELFLITQRVEIDKAVADSYRRGPEAFQMIQASGQLEAIMRLIGSQIYYGSQVAGGNDVNGFPGFVEMVDPSMVVDAGGTTANGKASVWFVRYGQNEDIALVNGKGQNMLQLSPEWRVESIVPDPTQPARRIDGYVNQWQGRVGLQNLTKNSLVQIKNLTDQSGKGMTDSIGYDALEKFPSGIRPDVCFMTRHTRTQLRKSRATNLMPNPPMPTEIDGILIEVTDSLVLTEA